MTVDELVETDRWLEALPEQDLGRVAGGFRKGQRYPAWVRRRATREIHRRISVDLELYCGPTAAAHFRRLVERFEVGRRPPEQPASGPGDAAGRGSQVLHAADGGAREA